jgi:hypothetical protein
VWPWRPAEIGERPPIPPEVVRFGETEGDIRSGADADASAHRSRRSRSAEGRREAVALRGAGGALRCPAGPVERLLDLLVGCETPTAHVLAGAGKCRALVVVEVINAEMLRAALDE